MRRLGRRCAGSGRRHQGGIDLRDEAPDIGASRLRPVVQDVEDGCVSYRAVGPQGLSPHSITNVGDGPSRHFIVELLGPSASDAPTEHQHNGRGRTEVLA
jgi:hypothetical protein